jgi:hypothetical protein
MPNSLASTVSFAPRSLQSPLQVFIDLGSSLTKVLYLDSKGVLGHLTMPPAVAVGIDEDAVQEFLSVNSGLSPHDAAWVQIPGEEGVIVVGHLASNYQGQSVLVQRKAISGLYRVLAVLGVLREMLNLPTEFVCDLGLALPVAEYTTRQILEESLKTNACFCCRGVELNVEFRLIDCQPEGYGLVRERRAELLKHGSANKTKIAAVMMGHRNLSLLVFSGSALQLNQCRSDGAGFVLAVETAARRIGVEPTVEGLLEAVATNKEKLRVQGAGVKPLNVGDAVRQGRATYWSAVTQFLQSHLPGGDYELVVGGGAAWSMQDELKSWMQETGLSVSFCESIQRKIAGTLRFTPGFDSRPLSSEEALFSLQIADAFVGFSALLTKIKKQFAVPGA